MAVSDWTAEIEKVDRAGGQTTVSLLLIETATNAAYRWTLTGDTIDMKYVRLNIRARIRSFETAARGRATLKVGRVDLGSDAEPLPVPGGP